MNNFSKYLKDNLYYYRCIIPSDHIIPSDLNECLFIEYLQDITSCASHLPPFKFKKLIQDKINENKKLSHLITNIKINSIGIQNSIGQYSSIYILKNVNTIFIQIDEMILRDYKSKPIDVESMKPIILLDIKNKFNNLRKSKLNNILYEK